VDRGPLEAQVALDQVAHEWTAGDRMDVLHADRIMLDAMRGGRHVRNRSLCAASDHPRA
jgi:hypothetical protein